MKFRRHSGLILAIVCSVVAGAMMLWLFQWVWHATGEHDRNPRRSEFSHQLMRLKSDSMQDILDGMLRGNASRVESAAKRMERYGDAIDGFLADALYEQHGAAFHQSVDDLIEAARQEDMEAAKETVLRLERTCIECHMLLNQPSK